MQPEGVRNMLIRSRSTEGARRRLHSRKLKGDYENLTVMVGMIAFIGALVALMVFVQTYLLNATADMKVSERDMQAVDAAHLVRDCLSYGDTIPLSVLKANDGGSICGMCTRISCSAYDVGAKLELLEGKQAGGPFKFGYKEGDSTHKIFVTVSDGANNYVARLYASLSDKVVPVM